MTADHQHAGFEIPAGYADPAGRAVDHQLLGQFVGAAFDGCTSCQDALLTLMVETRQPPPGWSSWPACPPTASWADCQPT